MANKIKNLDLLGTKFDILQNIPDYTSGETYPKDSVVVSDGSIFRANKDISSAPAVMADSDWDQVGGKDTAVVTVSSITANGTWTSNKTLDYLGANYETEPLLIVYNKMILYAKEIMNASTFFFLTQEPESVNLMRKVQLNADGSTTVTSISAVLNGTLTVKDSEGTSLGTYNGSSNTTVTLPESFEVLTTSEIDSIWENN